MKSTSGAGSEPSANLATSQSCGRNGYLEVGGNCQPYTAVLLPYRSTEGPYMTGFRAQLCVGYKYPEPASRALGGMSYLQPT